MSSICDCLHRSINGIEATEILMKEGMDGSFLIRPSSSSASDLTLSVRRDDDVVHIKIQSTDDYIDLYGGEQFASLPQLLEYYVNGEGKNQLVEKSGKPIRLKHPMPAPKHRNERWFHSGITSQEAEKKLKSLKKEGTFLVRESLTNKGDFVLSYLNKEMDVIHVIISKTKGFYSIGAGGKQFGSLLDLIDYFRTNDVTVIHKDKNCSFKLQKSLIVGAFKLSNLESKVLELEKEFEDRDKKRNGFWEEFEYIQGLESENYERPMTVGQAPENKVKNRYRNILPYDETRVKLKDVDPKVKSSDYINANFISVGDVLPHVKKFYIASQGCVKVTVPDFWNMVWYENVDFIVMTTELMENGKNKCFPYWSDTDDPLSVNLFSGPLTISTGSVEDKKDYTLRKFIVSHKNQSRSIFQYHHRKWPDKCTPKDASGVVEFVLDINKQAKLLKQQQQQQQQSPWLIHCSAGIGRTGTFILIDLIMNHIQAKGLDCTIDIPKLLIKIRSQRAGLVQTDKQYTFVYKAIQLFANKYFNKNSAETLPPTNLSSSNSNQMNKPKITQKPILQEQFYENL